MSCAANNRKEVAWQKICESFIINGFSRDKKRIKEQWKRMKASANKNISEFKKYQFGTGGGSP